MTEALLARMGAEFPPHPSSGARARDPARAPAPPASPRSAPRGAVRIHPQRVLRFHWVHFKQGGFGLLGRVPPDLVPLPEAGRVSVRLSSCGIEALRVLPEKACAPWDHYHKGPGEHLMLDPRDTGLGPGTRPEGLPRRLTLLANTWAPGRAERVDGFPVTLDVVEPRIEVAGFEWVPPKTPRERGGLRIRLRFRPLVEWTGASLWLKAPDGENALFLIWRDGGGTATVFTMVDWQRPLRALPPPLDDPDQRWWTGELDFLFPMDAGLMRDLLVQGDAQHGRGPIPAFLAVQARLFGWGTTRPRERQAARIRLPVAIPLDGPGRPR